MHDTGVLGMCAWQKGREAVGLYIAVLINWKWYIGR